MLFQKVLVLLVTGLCALPVAVYGNPKQSQSLERWGNSVVSARAMRALERPAPEPLTRFARGAASASVLLEVRGSAETLDRLEHSGLTLAHFSRSYGSAIVAIRSLQELEQLSRLPGVIQVDALEPRIVRAGIVNSRAPEAMQANSPDFGRAESQRIGVISDSFAITNAVRDTNTTPAAGQAGSLQGSRPQDSGDLPAVVSILEEGAAGNTDEGAAMAELAHDMAPGASLVFHAAGVSRASFAEAIDTLCDAGQASVVVDDIGFLLEPYYQDGIVAQAAQRCVAKGIPFVSAAGNDGDQAFRQQYVDLDPAGDDQPDRNAAFAASGADLHDWGGGDGFLQVTVPAGGEVYAVLQWNQPSASVNSQAGSQIDLDLYATRADSVLALNPSNPAHAGRSISAQGTTGQPLGDASEFLLLTGAAVDTTYYLAIEHYQGSQGDIPQAAGVPLEFRLVLVGAVVSAEYPYDGPAIWGHPTAEGVISVGAVPWWEAPPFAPASYGSPAIDPQPYSARGGSIPIQFDASGQYQSVQRFVPTLSGVDANNTSFFGSDFTEGANPGYGEPDGFPNFFGTSAAAPNIAALIALLQERFPSLTPAEVVDGLIASAVDVAGIRAASGTDSVSGAGLVSGEAALAYFTANPPTPREMAPPPAQASSGSGSSGGGGGCFIATAAWGTAWSQEVRLLREFRDRHLRRYAAGRWFIGQYYRYSPALADWITESETTKQLARIALAPLIYSIRYPLSTFVFSVALLGLAWNRHTRRLT